MSPRTLLIFASAALAVALIVLFMEVPRWLPPRVEPLPAQVELTPSVVPRVPLPGEICAGHQQRVCQTGDVWWLDGCGRRQERAESCDDALCRKGHCVQPEAGPPCEKLSEGGRCDGEILRYCDHGHARAVDCALLGGRCGHDGHGDLNCVPVGNCKTADVCEGDNAYTCEEGRLRMVECGPDGRCELDEHGHARCIKRFTAERLSREPCHGCACPSPSPLEPLAPVDVVAFLVADEEGQTAESEERARAAVADANAWFAASGHETGLSFNLREVRTIRRPSWLSASSITLTEAEKDPELHPRDQPFFVPVVFVETMQFGAKIAAGLGTFPGSSCADLPPRHAVHDVGVILLARLRYRTTLAHEMGHYFGLCHTHQRDPQVPEVTAHEDGTTVDCAVCGSTGDGVCDTPIDPGPDDGDCTLDGAACTVSCASGAAPDAANLMSYYIPCRRYFSDEQSAYLRRGVRLRLDAHAQAVSRP